MTIAACTEWSKSERHQCILFEWKSNEEQSI